MFCEDASILLLTLFCKIFSLKYTYLQNRNIFAGWLCRCFGLVWLVSRVEKWRTLSVMHADFVHWFQKSFFLFFIQCLVCKLCQENITQHFVTKGKKTWCLIFLFCFQRSWRGVLVLLLGCFLAFWERQSFKIFFGQIHSFSLLGCLVVSFHFCCSAHSNTRRRNGYSQCNIKTVRIALWHGK